MVIEAARNPLKLLATIQGVLAIAMVFAQTLYGTGEAKFVMFVELALHLGVMAPGAYLFGLVLEGGLVGAYVAPVIYGVALAVACLLRFKAGKWKTVSI
jgi:Na+-driven multidrug efflux pump